MLTYSEGLLKWPEHENAVDCAVESLRDMLIWEGDPIGAVCLSDVVDTLEWSVRVAPYNPVVQRAVIKVVKDCICDLRVCRDYAKSEDSVRVIGCIEDAIDTLESVFSG